MSNAELYYHRDANALVIEINCDIEAASGTRYDLAQILCNGSKVQCTGRRTSDKAWVPFL